MKAHTSDYERTFEFLKMLYGSSLEKGTKNNWVYGYLKGDDGIPSGEVVSFRTLGGMERFLRNKRSAYITPNQFLWQNSNPKNCGFHLLDASWLNALVLDFEDCEDVESVMAKLKLIGLDTRCKPTVIDKHVKGCKVWFLFDKPVELTVESIDAYKLMYDLLTAVLLQSTGVEASVEKLTRYERIPRNILLLDAKARVNFKKLYSESLNVRINASMLFQRN